jgi:hypothetical protein
MCSIVRDYTLLIKFMHSKITMNHLIEDNKTEVYLAKEKLGEPIFCFQFLGIPPISYVIPDF